MVDLQATSPAPSRTRGKVCLLMSVLATGLLFTGCNDEPVYAPAPPPPPAYGQTPPLIELAERNGFRAGFDDGGRDAYYRAGYQPRNNETYEKAPGYDYRLGPIPPYVDAFRTAYLRGYDKGYYRQQ